MILEPMSECGYCIENRVLFYSYHYQRPQITVENNRKEKQYKIIMFSLHFILRLLLYAISLLWGIVRAIRKFPIS